MRLGNSRAAGQPCFSSSNACIQVISPNAFKSLLPHVCISLRKFSSVKHVVIIAPDTLHPDVALALQSVVDQFIQRAPPVISQPQMPRWKTDDGSYRMKLMKAHALSLEQFEKVRPLLLALFVCYTNNAILRWPLLMSH
jgi:hypothetical protein